MKRYLFISALIIAVVLAGCKKTADDILPSSQSKMDMKKSPNPVPFNGTYTGVIETATENCTCDQATGWVCRNFIADGNANHIGNSEMFCSYCIRFSYPTPEAPFDGLIEGPGTITAANGDVLYGYFTGTFTFVWNNGVPISSIIEAAGVINGGTGNFEDVTGYMHAEGTMDLTINGLSGPVPTTLTFTGAIQYAGEVLDGEVVGEADLVYPSIEGCTGNSWNFLGAGAVEPMGPVSNTNIYCSNTIYGPWPYPNGNTIAYGGTMNGSGVLNEDADGDELYSTFTGNYSFYYNIPTNATNFAVGYGIITGGTGKYEGATGYYVLIGEQDVTQLILQISNQNLPSNFSFKGYVIY